jgi:DNA-binding GntR family transcriptional regulator
MHAQVLAHLGVLLPSLLDALAAPGERVVGEALAVQAAIAADDAQQFRQLMRELLDRCALPIQAPQSCPVHAPT